MTVATIAPQHTAAGLSPTFQAALAAGDLYSGSGSPTLQVKNAGPMACTVTLAAQQNCSAGVKHDLTFSVAANTTSPLLYGPVASSTYGDISGNVSVAYSSTVQPSPGALSAALLLESYALGIGVYRYAVTFVNATGETTAGTEISVTTVAGKQAVSLQAIPLGPAGTTARKVYRTLVGGATGAEKLLVTLSDNTTQTFTDTVPDALLGATLPGSNTAAVPAPGAASAAAGSAGNPNGAYKYQVTFVNANGETTGGVEFTITVASLQVALSSIPLGPTGTTARKIYRTAAAGASGTEKLVAPINDNTTTTYTDNTADGSLGAAIPTTNTATCVSVAVTAQ